MTGVAGGVEFDLGEVQPAALLRGVDELEAVPQGLLGWEGLVERSSPCGTQSAATPFASTSRRATMEAGDG